MSHASTRTGTGMLLGVAGTLSLALPAAQAQSAQPQASAQAPAAVSESQALRVVRDKATGKLRAPNADEAKAMDAAERAARKARGLPEVAEPQPVVIKRHASGMTSAKLGPEYLMSLEGERQADGSIRRFHADGSSHEHQHAPRDQRPTE